MTAIFVAATLVAVGWLLVAEHHGSQPGVWLWKPLASSGFVATAIAAGALGDGYGRSVLVALCLCWLGDVLVIPEEERWLRAGVLAFLAGHLAFVAAFVLRGIEPMTGLVVLALAALPAGLTIRWLTPHLSREFRGPVVVYACVISVMVAAAAATFAVAPRVTILAGAIALFLSDLSVSRDRFARRDFVNRAWGLPLYYVAQLRFAVGSG